MSFDATPSKDEATCNRCGHGISEHGVDPMTGTQTKCPVYRARKTTPPQEGYPSPRGDY